MKTERKGKGFTSISDIITPITQNIIGKQAFVEIEIILNWEKIVGRSLSDFSLPQKTVFKKNERNNGKLYIEVASGSFALEIKHKERIILDKINTYLGYNAISELAIIQNLNLNFSRINKDIQQLKKTLVSQNEEIYIKDIVNGLDNEELKKTLVSLGINIFSDENIKNLEREKNEI